MQAERARFAGDFDLPLQLVTRVRHRPMLEQWFAEAGYAAPSLEDAEADGDDEFSAE